MEAASRRIELGQHKKSFVHIGAASRAWAALKRVRAPSLQVCKKRSEATLSGTAALLLRGSGWARGPSEVTVGPVSHPDARIPPGTLNQKVLPGLRGFFSLITSLVVLRQSQAWAPWTESSVG